MGRPKKKELEYLSEEAKEQLHEWSNIDSKVAKKVIADIPVREDLDQKTSDTVPDLHVGETVIPVRENHYPNLVKINQKDLDKIWEDTPIHGDVTEEIVFAGENKTWQTEVKNNEDSLEETQDEVQPSLEWAEKQALKSQLLSPKKIKVESSPAPKKDKFAIIAPAAKPEAKSVNYARRNVQNIREDIARIIDDINETNRGLGVIKIRPDKPIRN